MMTRQKYKVPQYIIDADFDNADRGETGFAGILFVCLFSMFVGAGVMFMLCTYGIVS